MVTEVIARRLKEIMSKHITEERFGFLEGRQIHEAIGVAQEGLHSMKSKNIKGAILKIDLSKAYDQVNWTYLRVILSQMGFVVPFISWVM